MDWKNGALSALKSAFGERPFEAAEALKLLKKTRSYRPGTSYRLLSELEKRGDLEKLGRGIYRAGKKTTALEEPRIPESVERLASELRRNGLRGELSGFPILSAYTNLIPRRVIYLVYAPRGSGEGLAEFFKKKGNFAPVNPSLGELRAVLGATENKDIAVIREVERGFRGKAAVAPAEKAIVDLYFETTRKKIPFSATEAGRVIADAILRAKINIRKLFRAAARRGILEEMRSVVYAIRPDARLGGKPLKTNEHTKPFLEAARAYVK